MTHREQTDAMGRSGGVVIDGMVARTLRWLTVLLQLRVGIQFGLFAPFSVGWTRLIELPSARVPGGTPFNERLEAFLKSA
jgi:hypothetical protein